MREKTDNNLFECRQRNSFINLFGWVRGFPFFFRLHK